MNEDLKESFEQITGSKIIRCAKLEKDEIFVLSAETYINSSRYIRFHSEILDIYYKKFPIFKCRFLKFIKKKKLFIELRWEG